MATIKMSALVEDVRGPMGQIVFSNWKGRHYARYKAEYIGNPMTPEQSAVRSFLGASVQEWWKLTDIQRALWEEYAQGKGRARADEKEVGSKCLIRPRGILMSGFNAYIGVNQVLVSIGQPRVSVPSTQPAPSGITFNPVGASFCEPAIPGPFLISVKIKPLVPVYADTYARIWIKGVWAGSHGYIAKLSDKWALGEDDEKFIDIDTIRMGSVGGMEEIPLAHCMYIRLQADLCDALGESGPPSNCAVTHCLTAP